MKEGRKEGRKDGRRVDARWMPMTRRLPLITTDYNIYYNIITVLLDQINKLNKGIAIFFIIYKYNDIFECSVYVMK